MKLTIAILIATSAWAADPVTVARLYDGQLKSAESEIVPLVEAMPADKFNFAPTSGEFKGVRTFAQQAKHMAAVIYLTAAAVKQEKPPVEGGEAGPDSVVTKEQVVKFVKDAFAYGHKAMGTLTDKNQLDMVKSPFGGPDMVRGGIAQLNVEHCFDHYGQMVVYLRMNGLVPPASRR